MEQKLAIRQIWRIFFWRIFTLCKDLKVSMLVAVFLPRFICVIKFGLTLPLCRLTLSKRWETEYIFFCSSPSATGFHCDAMCQTCRRRYSWHRSLLQERGRLPVTPPAPHSPQFSGTNQMWPTSDEPTCEHWLSMVQQAQRLTQGSREAMPCAGR